MQMRRHPAATAEPTSLHRRYRCIQGGTIQRTLPEHSMSDPTPRDETGIRFPPPFIYGLFFLAGYLLQRLTPVTLVGGNPEWLDTVGLVLIGAGVAFAVTAAMTFRRAGTHVNPTKPATTI